MLAYVPCLLLWSDIRLRGLQGIPVFCLAEYCFILYPCCIACRSVGIQTYDFRKVIRVILLKPAYHRSLASHCGLDAQIIFIGQIDLTLPTIAACATGCYLYTCGQFFLDHTLSKPFCRGFVIHAGTNDGQMMLHGGILQGMHGRGNIWA